MAIKSGIFNSVNGDRRYKAEDFASYFAKFIGNGIFPNPSNGFQVVANSDMTVTLKAGNAWIYGYYATNDDDYTMALDVADGVLNRIDRVVLQLNYLNRSIVPIIKKGTFASAPAAPALKRDSDAYEIALADIRINKGVLSITQSNITDIRLNKDLCGIVHGTVEQVDTTTIFNQYQTWFNEFTIEKQAEFNEFTIEKQAEFNDWYTSIQNILSGDVAGNLLNKINQINSALAAHQSDYVNHPGTGKTTNSNSDYNIILNPSPTTYVANMGIIFTINADSTGATTLNVNGLGAKPIKKSNGNNVTNLKNNGVYTVRYNPDANAGKGAFILQGEGASGNAIASDLLSGKTASTDAGEIIGTLTLTGNATDDNVLAGKTYYNTDTKIKRIGTLSPGKKYASGAVTPSSTPMNFILGSGSTSSWNPATVTGLTFKPSVIKMKNMIDSTMSNLITYDVAKILPKYDAKIAVSDVSYTGAGASSYGIKEDGVAAYVTDTGFRLPAKNTPYEWEAWE